MQNQPILPHGVMEGKGAYNKYAKVPAGGAALALPLLERAALDVALDTGDLPVVVADYGSSQGKNSLGPMHLVIAVLRDRLGPQRSIFVYHIDQPSNDFQTLFEVLHADPDRYNLGDTNMFPGAIGRSFYENVLPPASVHLGWSSYAAVWLSHIPTLIPDHFMPIRSTGAERLEFERQGARDWEDFLSLRAKELRPGGRLVVVLPALADDGTSGFENIMDQANAVLAAMVADGALRADERARMVLGAWPRRTSELLAPFNRDGRFQNLTVDACEMFALPDAAWKDYEQDGNREALATKHALFFRSIFMPSLASALDHVRAGEADAVRAFGDRLEAGLKQRIADQPTPMHSFAQTIVLARQTCQT
jgi:SAM dependent carboxyl methyltransferase